MMSLLWVIGACYLFGYTCLRNFRALGIHGFGEIGQTTDTARNICNPQSWLLTWREIQAYLPNNAVNGY